MIRPEFIKKSNRAIEFEEVFQLILEYCALILNIRRLSLKCDLFL